MKKLIKNYTTEIPVERTISEINRLLAENGATAIATEYEDGIIKRIFFKIKVKDKELPFRLPAKPDNVYKTLFGNMIGEATYGESRRKKAEMIAWRICKLWLEAQITHINLEQAQMEEVFLPYLVVSTNKTLYQAMEEQQFLLPGGSK